MEKEASAHPEEQPVYVKTFDFMEAMRQERAANDKRFAEERRIAFEASDRKFAEESDKRDVRFAEERRDMLAKYE